MLCPYAGRNLKTWDRKYLIIEDNYIGMENSIAGLLWLIQDVGALKVLYKGALKVLYKIIFGLV